MVLVEDMGGELSLESDEGKGVKFLVKVPLTNKRIIQERGKPFLDSKMASLLRGTRSFIEVLVWRHDKLYRIPARIPRALFSTRIRICRQKPV